MIVMAPLRIHHLLVILAPPGAWCQGYRFLENTGAKGLNPTAPLRMQIHIRTFAQSSKRDNFLESDGEQETGQRRKEPLEMARQRIKRWSIEEAQSLFREIEPIAKSHGFLLAVAGSVITHGQGQDLDLVAVPNSSESNRDSMLRAVAAHIGISLPGIHHTQESGISVGFVYQSKMVDFFVANLIAHK